MRSRTSAKSIQRQMEISQFLSLRLQGVSFRQIGEMQTPPVSPQAIYQAIANAIRDIVAEPIEQIRALEACRLDELLMSVYEKALSGDIPAVNACLAMMQRRARLLGLDLQPGGSVLRFRDGMEEADEPVLRVEIIGNPEIERMKWLEEKVRGFEAGEPVEPSKLN